LKINPQIITENYNSNESQINVKQFKESNLLNSYNKSNFENSNCNYNDILNELNDLREYVSIEFK